MGQGQAVWEQARAEGRKEGRQEAELKAAEDVPRLFWEPVADLFLQRWWYVGTNSR